LKSRAIPKTLAAVRPGTLVDSDDSTSLAAELRDLGLEWTEFRSISVSVPTGRHPVEVNAGHWNGVYDSFALAYSGDKDPYTASHIAGDFLKL